MISVARRGDDSKLKLMIAKVQLSYTYAYYFMSWWNNRCCSMHTIICSTLLFLCLRRYIYILTVTYTYTHFYFLHLIMERLAALERLLWARVWFLDSEDISNDVGFVMTTEYSQTFTLNHQQNSHRKFLPLGKVNPQFNLFTLVFRKGSYVDTYCKSLTRTKRFRNDQCRSCLDPKFVIQSKQSPRVAVSKTNQSKALNPQSHQRGVRVLVPVCTYSGALCKNSAP